MKNNYISVGKILNFHGVKGEAKLGYSKNREDFLSSLSSLYVYIDNNYEKLDIASIRYGTKHAIIKFKKIDTLNDILKYKGCLVFVDESEIRKHLDDDEFLIDELVGLAVYDGEKRVGFVVGVSNNGASDLLSIKTNANKVSLVPFVKAIVLAVDLKSKRIQINNIEGLLS